MVVGCPKCKVRLNIPDEKIAPQGTKFKCPKCGVLLLVRKPAQTGQAPAPKPQAPVRPSPTPAALNRKKILVAHADPAIAGRIQSVIESEGYLAITALDGVDALVKAMKELPFIIMADVALPRIYGFELIKRVQERPELRGVKAVLLSSVYDERRYRREPASLHGADDYLDEHEIESLLPGKLKVLSGNGSQPAGPSETEKPQEPVRTEPARPQPEPEQAAPEPAKPEHRKPACGDAARTDAGLQAANPALEAAGTTQPAAAQPSAQPEKTGGIVEDQFLARAKRLARTIMADINLYSPDKVDSSIRNNNFAVIFASELREGKKLYENRIPQEIRNRGDFFQEAMDNFIESRKKALGLA
ncbi:MAG: zinc-ribbon domain-containing protein [Actinomycetota bacterium]|nr:zinc-ribbon domain-containing protein [Actinomycetota bacterium]